MKSINQYSKFYEITNNWINGNFSDYTSKIKNLTKVDLIRFADFLVNENLPYRLTVNGNGTIILINE